MNGINIRTWVLVSGLSFSPFLWAAEPLSCMQLTKQTGGWNGGVTVSNQCGQAVDLRDSLVEFKSNHALSGSFWGSFSPLAYPENPSMTHEPQGDGHLVRMALTFPAGNEWWKPNTMLPAGGTISLQFSTSPETTIDQLAFYPITKPAVKKGQVAIQFPSAPDQSLANPSTVTISDGGAYSKTITNGAWNQATVITDVPFGNYQIAVQPIELSGGSWSGVAEPANLSVNSTSQQTVNIRYQQAIAYGAISVTLNQGAPEEGLATPVLTVKNLTSNTELPAQPIEWNGQTIINQLTLGDSYQLTVATLYGSEHRYVAQFNPNNTLTIDGTDPKPVHLTFETQALPTATINVSVSGLPTNQTATLTAKDNKGNAYPLTVSSNAGKDWTLPSNRQYQFSASVINVNDKRYQPEITPTSLLLQADSSANLNVAYQEKPMVTEFSPYVDVTLGTVAKWDSKTSSMQPLGLLEIAKHSGLKSFHLAFITAQNGCQGTWNGYPVSTDENGFGVPVFKQLKAQGVELRVALGGLSGTYLAQVCDSTDALYHAYETIIKAYQPDVLDFDVENTMQTNNAQLDRLMEAIKRIEQNYPHIKISFTLPVMPYGLVPGVGENVIKRAQLSGLDDYLVNVMAMDYGSSFQEKTMGEYAIDAGTSTFNQLKALYPNQSDEQLWNRVGVTVMIGLNDTIPLNFTLKDVDTLKQFAEEKQMGLLSFWSVTRDYPCSSNYVSITCSSLDPKTNLPNQTVDFEYSKRFSQ
ncbi:chitinase [Legionella yabuuchiae]|uniref:chitinase n=1 Tax=Legionella yabuuchiae TaxID=376727 RepID=UPI00105571C5|nr:chitinase [Legionella yabuuchiae]